MYKHITTGNAVPVIMNISFDTIHIDHLVDFVDDYG